jgi:hypothetical protein
MRETLPDEKRVWVSAEARMALPDVTFVGAQQLHYERFRFHADTLSCGVKGPFFSQKVVPVPVPALFECNKKRPFHGSSRFTLLLQASVKPGPTKRPWSCKSLYAADTYNRAMRDSRPTASGSGGRGLLYWCLYVTKDPTQCVRHPPLVPYP